MADKDKLRFNIPMSEYDRLAWCFLPDIPEFFESEEGQKEYQQWLEENGKNKKTKTKKSCSVEIQGRQKGF